MDHEHAFVQAVRANPHEDTARLILADYFEELGDERCELIRVQVELSRLPPGHPARRELELRESQLLDQRADQWLAPLKALGAEGVSARCFQRGLIERARVAGPVFLQQGDALCREAPALFGIELRQAGPVMAQLAARPLPAQVTSLDLSSNKLKAAELEHLALAPWRPQITSLSLAFNQLTDDGLRALAAVDWPVLARLDLNVNRLTADGLQALARRPATPLLRSLSLNANPLGDAGLMAIAESPLALTLRDLDIGTTRMTAAAIARLAATPLLANLESLVLRGNVLGERYLQAMEVLAQAPRLKRLDLRGTLPTTAQYGYGSGRTAVPEVLRNRFGDNLLW